VSGAALTTEAGRPIALERADAFLLHVRVAGDDIDAQGHVNNAVYLKWMDRAAYEHSSAIGYDWAAYQRLGAAFVVRRHEVDYLSPGWPDEPIVVATWPGAMKRFTALRHHQIVSRRDGRTLVRAVTTWVYLDLKTGRPARMPVEMIEAFRPRE
jgi:acyl-CoA thioester hydrolase